MNSRGGSGTATGTSAWTASAIALQLGSNVLTVTARDAAGNTAIANLTVTLSDTTSPTVAVTAPAAGTTVTSTVVVSGKRKGLAASTSALGAQDRGRLYPYHRAGFPFSGSTRRARTSITGGNARGALCLLSSYC